ncbi:MAG TPA: HAMP domain-containing sensor histidine kinase [Acidothermaceae bacterium]|nr:HAMP domain-containing sensor histidine kinase [Acidothermaceae bacterium]
MIGRERSLVAEASHQLRTPLTGLRLELEALRDIGRPDSRIESALAAVDRLETTITDIIALARDLPVQQVAHVPDLIAAAQRGWHGPLAEATRPLRVVVDASVPSDIALSTPAATQILDALIDNALRHGQGAVTVHVREVGGLVAVDVSDEGPTLRCEAHELFQLRDGTRDGGIGLPFARKLAEAENARVALTRHDPPTFTRLASAAPASTRRD